MIFQKISFKKSFLLIVTIFFILPSVAHAGSWTKYLIKLQNNPPGGPPIEAPRGGVSAVSVQDFMNKVSPQQLGQILEKQDMYELGQINKVVTDSGQLPVLTSKLNELGGAGLAVGDPTAADPHRYGKQNALDDGSDGSQAERVNTILTGKKDAPPADTGSTPDTGTGDTGNGATDTGTPDTGATDPGAGATDTGKPGENGAPGAGAPGAAGGAGTEALGQGADKASSATSIPESGEIPFGGLHTGAIECTCEEEVPGTSLHYIYDFTTLTTLALLYVPETSILYSDYNPYAAFQLGTYIPMPVECLVEAGDDCESTPGDGMYGNVPGTGTTTTFLSNFFGKFAEVFPRIHS